MKKPLLYYLGKPEDGFGWGVANTNITRALADFCDVSIDTSKRDRFDAPVFVPIADHSLEPLRKVRAPRVLGYCFTEWPITFNAHRNARQYDVLFAGSNWNVHRLQQQGITAAVLHQGIDFDRFTVQPASSRQGFVIFSGGKFEYRKGQDYVIAALRHFMKFHDDALLLTAWHNPWPESRLSMANTWLLDDWTKPLADLPADRVIQMPAVANEQTPGIYAQAHIGIFPNRCEAGTNLVMCEFMACGRPVIATNAHGHKDVFEDIAPWANGPFLIENGTLDPAGWFNCAPSDIMTCLEYAYDHRDQLTERATECRRLVEKFTWRECALKIARAAFPQMAFPQSTGFPGFPIREPEVRDS